MKVLAQLGSDGVYHFRCPRPECGKRMRLPGNSPGGRVTCPNPQCRLRLEVEVTKSQALTPGIPKYPPTTSTIPAPPAPPPVPIPAIKKTPPIPEFPRENDKRRTGKGASTWILPTGIALGSLVLIAGVVSVAALWSGTSKTKTGNNEQTQQAKNDSTGKEIVSSKNKTNTKSDNKSSSSTPEVVKEKPKPVSKTPQQIEGALAGGCKCTGTLKPEHVTEGFFPRTEHSHRWNADFIFVNQTATPIELGEDYFLIEIPSSGTYYDGFAVFRSKSSSPVGPVSYGLDRNYENNGSIINKGGGRIRYTFGGGDPALFGVVEPGKSWNLKRGFPQYSWLREDVRSGVCLVLPEFRIHTTEAVLRYRLLVYFMRPAANQPWVVTKQLVVPLRLDELKNRLTNPTGDLISKVLAMNWLTEHHAKESGPLLIEAAKPLREGQLLGTSLTLLTALKTPGLESHAMDLLQDAKLPNGIRGGSAQYLGVVRHQPALKVLMTTAKDGDSFVANSAVDGLGTLGGKEAIDFLTTLLRDETRPNSQSAAGGSLARSRDPAALKLLQDEVVAKKNMKALQALTAAGWEETYDFFVQQAEKTTDLIWQAELGKGLKAAGGKKALPVLLQMLATPKNPGPSAQDGLIWTIVDMNLPEATDKLTTMAREGNVRAVRVLASTRNPSVQAPLTELARKSVPAVQAIALDGLAANWAEKSFDVFADAMKSEDVEVVRAAVRGLPKTKDSRMVPLLIGVLEHKDVGLRQSACWPLEQQTLGDQTAKVAEVMLRSKDDTVVSSCIRALTKAKWKDPKAIATLGKKLQTAPEFRRLEIVRLLRHLSGDAMGPSNDTEWYKDPKGWYQKWVDWANKQ